MRDFFSGTFRFKNKREAATHDASTVSKKKSICPTSSARRVHTS